jgi:hypothetical protein
LSVPSVRVPEEDPLFVHGGLHHRDRLGSPTAQHEFQLTISRAQQSMIAFE